MRGKKKVFYIVINLFLILVLNFVFSRQIRERFFLKQEKEICFAGIFFKVSHKWPLPSCEGNKEKGSIVFCKTYHPGKYNWYFIISWDKKDIKWKEFLPPLSKTEAGDIKPEYIFGEIYEQEIKFKHQIHKSHKMNVWIRRSCGIKDDNWGYLFEFKDSDERYFKIVGITDTEEWGKSFSKIISSLKIE